MNIYSKIRNLREMKGFSQEFMAIQLDISQKTYGRLENGEAKLHIQRLFDIAKILEMDIYQLLSIENCNNITPEKDKNTHIKGNLIDFDPAKNINYSEKYIQHLEDENRFLKETIITLASRNK